MNSTHAQVSVYKKSDLAQPYKVSNKAAKRLYYIKNDKTMHAAGGIITTAKDAANWLRFNLNDGRFNGEQIVTARSMDEIHSAQIDLKAKFYNYRRFAYGLGWYLSDYNGDLLIHHFGGYAGFRSHISFMPKYKIGVASFVNDSGEGFFLPDLIADYVYNLLSNKKDVDQITDKEFNEYKERIEKHREKIAAQKEEKNFLSGKEIKELTGTFYNKEFGTMRIFFENKGLVVKLGDLQGTIKEPKKNHLIAELIAFKSQLKPEMNSNKIVSVTLSSIPWPDKKFDRIK